MSIQTHPSIHGHEVIHLIQSAASPLTRAELAEAVARQFGPAARFHTCSAERLTLEGLLAFLAERGKLIERQDGRLVMDMSRVCNHEDHE